MKKVWEISRQLAAVDHSLKVAKSLVRVWAALTLMQIALIAVTLIAPGSFRWWQIIVQLLTLFLDVIFLHTCLRKLSRARARSEHEEWVVLMHEAMRE